jgi:hypothetical protein
MPSVASGAPATRYFTPTAIRLSTRAFVMDCLFLSLEINARSARQDLSIERAAFCVTSLPSSIPAPRYCPPWPGPPLDPPVAEIDGVVTRRNVNPGNDVQVGQSLMAIRSLSEIWVDANFKETQLQDERIGKVATAHIWRGRYGRNQPPGNFNSQGWNASWNEQPNSMRLPLS